MTLEVVLSTAFGRSLDVQGGKGGKLFEAAVKVFREASPPKRGDRPSALILMQLILSKFFYADWHLVSCLRKQVCI